MATANLTKRTIDALPFMPGSDYFVWDDRLKGFGIRVTERTGSDGVARRRKVFVLGYRPKGSRQFRRLNIGVFGVLTSDQARDQALQHLARVSTGHDPVAEERARAGGLTVRELGVSYFEEATRRRRTSTIREYDRVWKKHVLPATGTKAVAAVTHADVRRLHRGLHKTPIMANRVVARLRTFFSYAIAEGAIATKENPARGIEFYPERARERFLSEDEFRRLGQALVRAEVDGLPRAPELRRKLIDPKKQKHRPKGADVPVPANPFAIAAIRLLALTGCREGEILGLRWDAVDFDRGYLRLDATKTGRSVRPLGQAAADILTALPRVEGNSFVLPGLKPKTHLREIKRVWYAIRHEANLEGFRLHDLRHSFASVSATDGDSLLVVAAMLGHRHTDATARYAHLADHPVKRAADRTAGSIAGWLGTETR